MQPTDDSALLRQYAENHSDEAFAALVTRHINLVYSVARRHVGDPHQAEEVTQAVFILLANKAAQLRHDKALSSWLFQATRLTASNFVRGETRRHHREQEAHMQSLLNEPGSDVWRQIAPLLDTAVADLNEKDRQAIVLRFYEGRNLREVGAVLGASEDAAEKRVNRAVEKLRTFFAKRGVSVSSTALAVVLGAHAVQAAPVGLAVAISAAALAALSIPASAGVAATTGFFGTLWHVSQAKFLAGLAAAVLVGVVVFFSFRSHRWADSAPVVLQSTSANPEQNQQTAGATTQDANVAEDQREPDPLKLLLAVARARQRIVSGSMEFQVNTEHFGPGRRQTNHVRVSALLDGSKLRSESFAREYGYTYSADEDEQEEIKKRADSMDRQAAVSAGLLKPFESHHTVAYDGVVLLDYWENDGKPVNTSINDPAKGTSQIIFDPRCLGLRTWLSVGTTVENCLGYQKAKSIHLLGEESVEGVPAWHVQVHTKFDEKLDFWLEASEPTRVLKHARRDDFVVSKYEDKAPRDPIPVEVTGMEFRNGSPSFSKRFIRSNSRFNAPIDPVAFTLAGLGMPVGTSVIDSRNWRQIGYWTGAGLSENLPRKGAEAESAPNMGELLALLEYYPTSPDALEAATWILLNTPDGAEVEKAAKVILREHTSDTNLVHLCNGLERVRHRCSKELLETILKNNLSREVRGTACFTLATLLKDEAKFGQNKTATERAEKLFQRVITEFGQAGRSGPELARRAKPELYELRRLIIGKPAPDTEGEDLDGRPMKLSDHRGKVIVLIFWSGEFNEARAYRKLIEGMAGEPFALLGVNCDRESARARASVEKHEITWPSFQDGRNGPISSLWNVDSWPDIWVLDRQGSIRYRNVSGRELDKAVDTLLRE
jgi:RNA polymerase sigma factor (sigma-70 family)